MKWIKLLIFLLGITIHLSGQQNIQGTVVNEQGAFLPGVSVSVKNTQLGTTTDKDGLFQLSIPKELASGVLQFSYLGYAPLELQLGTSTVFNVSLKPSISEMEELVVIGYGSQQKRKLTGNIATIKGEDIQNLPAQSFDQLLQGKATGVNVSLPNGVLNNPPVFRIRGINSISLSSFPLIVVDGIPSFTGDLSTGYPSFNFTPHNALAGLNPADIESIEILKDASASAIYGSRASAGVVLITTKSGVSGKSKVNYDTWVGLTEPARLPKLLNASQYLTIKNEAVRNAGLPTRFFLDSLNGQAIDTRWYDYAYRTGLSMNHNLNFSGGTAKTTYYLSLQYTKQDGFIKNNSYERLSGRFNLEQKISNRFKIGTNVSYSKNVNESPSTGSVPGNSFYFSGLARNVIILPPIVGPFNAEGEYNINSALQLGSGKNLQTFNYPNPLPALDQDRYNNQVGQLQASVYAQLEPLKGLTLKTQYGIVDILTLNEFFSSPLSTLGAYIFKDNLHNQRWNWQNTASYQLVLANRHTFEALIGNEQQYTDISYFGGDRSNVADPFFATFGGNFLDKNVYGYDSKNFLFSTFSRLNYTLDQKYLFSFNLRQDEYSAFAPENRKGVFWGASAGWVLSKESFWQKGLGKIINFFKLRGSYGEVGNNGVSDFAAQSLFDSGLYGDDATFFFSQAGNPNLSWETSKKTDIGFQFGLFNDRIQGEYAWFKSLIDGLLLQTPQPSSLGIPNNAIVDNVGSMQNIGHELSISARILQSPKFSWKSSVSLTFVKNKVLTLAEGGDDIFGLTAGFETTNITRIGESIGSLYAVPTQGVNPVNGQRIFINASGQQVQYQHVSPGGGARWSFVSDNSVAPRIDPIADGRLYGPAIPTWFGGWDNHFQLGQFELGVQLNFAGGNYVYYGTKAGLRDQRFWNNHTDVLNRWTESNPKGTIPRLVFGDNVSNGSAIPISENIEKADFLRVRNVSLAYHLPNAIINKLRLSNLRVYANLSNAFLITGYSGTDPEVSTNGNENLTPGIDRNTAPMARTFSIGFNLGF